MDGVAARGVARAGRDHRLAGLIGLVALALTGCARPPRATARPPAPRLVRYVFEVDPALERMQATVCFEGGLPTALVATHHEARARLEGCEIVDGEDRVPLAATAGRIDLGEMREGACVRYGVALGSDDTALAGGGGAQRVGADVVTSTALWLWAPEPLEPWTQLRARFVLPPGMRTSPLWPEARGGWLRLDERAFRYLAFVAFGDLEVERVSVPGGCLEVVTLDGPLRADRDARARWLGAAGRAVARLYGGFPAERTAVIVVPTPGADAVLFGIVGRGVLPTVALYVGSETSPATLAVDWVAVHELVHLGGPVVPAEDSWLTEGLATYYQGVLRAREGMIDERRAWSELLAGMERGRHQGTGRSLAEETRQMMRTFAFRRVYWSGAAIALLADVELRRSSAGARSLDDAMRRAAARRDQTLSAAELLRAMDGQDGGPIARIAARWVDGSEFPDVGPALRWLGVGAEGLDGSAPGADVRTAIMNERAPSASIPGGCDGE